MKFLIDECIGRSIFNWMKVNNYDVSFVSDECKGAADDFVLEKANQENRVLVTCDKDFGDMVFRDQKKHKGIILLRLQDESSKNKIHVLRAYPKNPNMLKRRTEQANCKKLR